MENNDQGATDPLIEWLDGKDSRPFKRASDAEIEASLRRLMDEQELHYNSDRLGLAAWGLTALKKSFAPAVVLAWLKERHSRGRLRVVLLLLTAGLWRNQPGMPPPDPALVEEVLSAHDGLPFDPMVENYMILALIYASHPGLPAPLAVRVRSILEHARAGPDVGEWLKKKLDDFLSKPPG